MYTILSDKLVNELRRKLYLYIIISRYHDMMNSALVIQQTLFMADIKIKI